MLLADLLQGIVDRMDQNTKASQKYKARQQLHRAASMGSSHSDVTLPTKAETSGTVVVGLKRTRAVVKTEVTTEGAGKCEANGVKSEGEELAEADEPEEDSEDDTLVVTNKTPLARYAVKENLPSGYKYSLLQRCRGTLLKHLQQMTKERWVEVFKVPTVSSIGGRLDKYTDFVMQSPNVEIHVPSLSVTGAWPLLGKLLMHFN